MSTCLLNLSNPVDISLESDRYTDLRDRDSAYVNGSFQKHCRSWHSWAYALKTEFFVYGYPGWPGCYKYDNIIVLLNRDIPRAITEIEKLKKAGKNIAISYHEGVADLLKNSVKIVGLKQALQHGVYINIFGQYQDMFEGLFGRDKVKFVNHGAPTDFYEEFRKPWTERTGDILVVTRTFNQHLARNTLATLSAMKNYLSKNPERRVDFITEDQGIEEAFKVLGFEDIKVHQGPFDYTNWLRFISNYKWAVHHDLSMNLGQVSLDCALTDVIPVGGTTWFNIMMGSDDGGDLRKLMGILEWDDIGYHLDELSKLRDLITPDLIGKNLEEVFNG